MTSNGSRERLIDFSALMDLTFQRFVTIGIIKLVYLIGLLIIAVAFLFMIVAGFSQGMVAGIGAIIVAPIVAFVWMLFLRIYLELIVVLFRIAENTSIMAGKGGLGHVDTGLTDEHHG